MKNETECEEQNEMTDTTINNNHNKNNMTKMRLTDQNKTTTK